MCQTEVATRGNLKRHLTLLRTSDKKPRCTKLKKVMSVDVWNNEILPHYVTDAPLPQCQFIKRSPMGKRKRKPVDELTRKDKIKERLIKDELIDKDGNCIYSEGEILAMFFAQTGNDWRWLLRKVSKVGVAEIRRQLSIPSPQKRVQLPPREALELKTFTSISMRGYQLLRNKIPDTLPARNHLDAVGRSSGDISYCEILGNVGRSSGSGALNTNMLEKMDQKRSKNI